MAERLTYEINVNTSGAVQQLKTFTDAVKQSAQEAKQAIDSIGKAEKQVKLNVQVKNAEKAKAQFRSLDTATKILSKNNGLYQNSLKQTPALIAKINKHLRDKLNKTKYLAKDGKKVTEEYKKLKTQVQETARALEKMRAGTGGSFNRTGIGGFLGKLSLVQVAANLGTSAIMGLGRALLGVVTGGQQLNILLMQLEAFVGSSEKAKQTWEGLQVVAARTTFNTEEVVKANQILLSYGVSADKAFDATSKLATIASATGGDINLLSRNLGQVSTQGRAYTRDLTQFALQGIPIWGELSKVIGKSAEEVKALAAEGQIGLPEVSAALDNMTQKGSVFATIADRMQNTWPALMEQLVGAFQNLSLAIAQAFDVLDTALGGAIKGTFKALIAGVDSLAKNFVNLLPAITAVGVALAVFYSPALFAGFKTLIGFLVAKIAKIWAAVTAQTTLNVAMGNFVAVAATAGAAAVTYELISNAIDETKEKTFELTQLTLKGALASEDYGDRFLNSLLQLRPELKGIIEDYKEKKGKVDELNAAIKGQMAMIGDNLKAYKDAMDQEIALIDKKIGKIRDSITEEKEAYKEAKRVVKERYDQELNDLRQVISEREEFYDSQIEGLEQLSAAEQQVRNKRKKDLQDKVKNNSLSKDERIEAQATLDRMIRNEQIAVLRKQRQQEINGLKKEEKDLEDDKKQKLNDINEQERISLGLKRDQIKELEREKGRMKDVYDLMKKRYNDEMNELNGVKGTMEEIKTRIDNQYDAISETRTEWQRLDTDLKNNLLPTLKEAAIQASKIKPPSSTSNAYGTTGYVPQRDRLWTGGPVKSGTAYTVNELGQEAFLSSSGKLSNINVPAFGKWIAPGSGTVIPAHIAAGLDIPSGGMNVKGRTPAGADQSGNTKLLKGMLNALKQGGGSTTNNVTIQSTNTSKAASDILVSLARIKRRRYN